MPPEDRIRILHILEGAETAARFISGRARTDLDIDQMLLFALVRARDRRRGSRQVTPPSRAALPLVPSGQIVAIRNRLVHAYFDINRDVLWKKASEEVPVLLPMLKAALADGLGH